MVRQMFKEQRRDQIMVNFLQARGRLLLSEIRDGARQEQALAPLADLSDETLRQWLISIDGIDSKIGRRNSEEFFFKSKPPLESCLRQSYVSISPRTPASTRRNVSPAANPPQKRSFLPVLLQAAENKRSKQRLFTRKEDRAKPTTSSQNCQPYKTDLPNLYSALLIGDDNFLNLAVFDLKFEDNREKGRRQSGGCVSGLRIAEATRFVMSLEPESVEHVVINVGGVDVAEGKSLIRMITDYKELVRICLAKSIRPILTTLTPQPNCLHDARGDNLLGLNEFIRFGFDDDLPFIDLYTGMFNIDGRINWNMYQPEPRFIGGSKKAVVLWNSAGRQTMYKILEYSLGFATLHRGSQVRFNF